MFGPIIGGVIGALIYAFLIGPQINPDHLPQKTSISPFLPVKPGDWRNTFYPKAFPPPVCNNGNLYPPHNNNNIAPNSSYPNRSVSPYPGSSISLPYSMQGYSNGIVNQGSDGGKGNTPALILE